MIVVFTKYPHLLDEAPGLGDLKTTAPPRQDEYVRCSSLSSSRPHPYVFFLSRVPSFHFTLKIKPRPLRVCDGRPKTGSSIGSVRETLLFCNARIHVSCFIGIDFGKCTYKDRLPAGKCPPSIGRDMYMPSSDHAF